MYIYNTGLYFIMISFRQILTKKISALVPKSIVVHTESLSNVAEYIFVVIVFIDFSPLSLIVQGGFWPRVIFAQTNYLFEIFL